MTSATCSKASTNAPASTLFLAQERVKFRKVNFHVLMIGIRERRSCSRRSPFYRLPIVN